MADLNHYASPQSGTEVISTSKIQRVGKVLVLPNGWDLPSRCVECNASAERPIKKRTIYWFHPAWYSLSVLMLVMPVLVVVFLIVAALVSKKAKISPGLCAVHTKERLSRLALGWMMVVIGGAVLVFGIRIFPNSRVVPLVGLAIFIVALIVLVLNARLLKPSRISNDEIRLKGCGDAFLASFPGE
ncbi:MAG TPA: hypothetical protein VIF82_17815 [Burkholderiaceae bacterium]|jgi:hypothetical protein